MPYIIMFTREVFLVAAFFLSILSGLTKLYMGIPSLPAGLFLTYVILALGAALVLKRIILGKFA